MFLIPPKRQSPTRESEQNARPPSPPTAHAAGKKQGRVRSACTRCRIKKIKCDGHFPCGRCVLDKATCKSHEQPRGKVDLKGISRDYIASLETQQRRLLDVLRQLYQDDPEDERVKSVVEKLEAGGFDIGVIKNTPGPHHAKTSNKHSASREGQKDKESQASDTMEGQMDGIQGLNGESPSTYLDNFLANGLDQMDATSVFAGMAQAYPATPNSAMTSFPMYNADGTINSGFQDNPFPYSSQPMDTIYPADLLAFNPGDLWDPSQQLNGFATDDSQVMPDFAPSDATSGNAFSSTGKSNGVWNAT